MDGEATDSPGMADAPKRKDRLARVLDTLQAAAGADKGVRSPLYRWMKKNHDRLSLAFDETPPSWSALAVTFGKIGLTDRDGKAPTPKGARQTWYRVRLDVVARGKRQLAAEPKPRGPHELAAGVETIARPADLGLPSVAVTQAAAARPKIDFGPAVARNAAPVVGGQSNASATFSVPGTMATEEVDEKLRTVLAGLGGSSRTKMPRRVE